MAYKGVFFDLYGTLLVFGDMHAAWADWLGALHRCLGQAGLRMDRETLARRCDGFFSQPEPPPTDGLTLFECRIQSLARQAGPGPRPPADRRDRRRLRRGVAELHHPRPRRRAGPADPAKDPHPRPGLQLRPPALRPLPAGAARPGQVVRRDRDLGGSRREEARPRHLPDRPGQDRPRRRRRRLRRRQRGRHPGRRWRPGCARS